MKKLFTKQDGSVLVMTVLCMSILLAVSAFVMDFGMEYLRAGELQNALDCAALAAVMELPASGTGSEDWDYAKSMANGYMELNGFSGTSLLYEPVYENGMTGGEITGIRLSADIKYYYSVMRILGLGSAVLSRSSEAELKPVSAMSGNVPLCITAESIANLNVGETTTLKFGSQSESGVKKDGFFYASGWFGIIRLDGSGASEYKDDFINGCSRTVSVGDVLEMQTGNLSGPTEQAYYTRIAGHNCCSYVSHEDTCPRIIVIPVVTVDVSKQVKVVAFASFFLEDVTGDGTDSIITATYLKNTRLSGSAESGECADYGVHVLKLTG